MILELRAWFPDDGPFTELSDAAVAFPPQLYGIERAVCVHQAQ
jgi:hypothetical protein